MEAGQVEDENKLVQQAVVGDRQAFDALVASCRPWVFGICLRLISNRQTAEDLTQDALLQAFSHLAQLRQASHFRAWLGQITVNTCRMYLRALLTAPDEEITEEQPMEAPPQDDTAPLGVETALTQLDITNRRLLLLFYGEELSHAEIAAALSLSAAAVKSRLHRAREKLRREMLAMMSEAQKAKLVGEAEQPWVLRTVLLVEPDLSIQTEIRQGLADAGYEVVVLPTGESALEAVQQHRGQMLILDKHCIEPNWIEVLSLIRVDTWSRANVPVCALGDSGVSASGAPSRDVLLAWQAGAEIYLTRPPQVTELVGFVKRLAKEWGRDLKPPEAG
jgi:RNA polymerase sigma-70 factor, ECF subfamily